MHRTYSLRQSRAPTAAQIENPPPPLSTTKSNRWLGKGGLGECWSSENRDLVWLVADSFGHLVRNRGNLVLPDRGSAGKAMGKKPRDRELDQNPVIK